MNIKRFLLAIVAILSIAIFSGCEEKQDSATLRLSETVFNVTADGGEFTVAYELVNPKTLDATLKVEPDEEWVKDIDLSIEGNIKFYVEKSRVDEARSCNVYVTHPDVKEPCAFIVNQEVGNSLPFDVKFKDVKEVSFGYDILVADQEQYYIYLMVKSDYFAMNDLNTDDEIFDADMSYFDYLLEHGWEMKDVWDTFAYQGDLMGQFQGDLTSDTEYTLYIYGVSFDGEVITRTSDIQKFDVKTLAKELQQANWELSYKIMGPNAEVYAKTDFTGPYHLYGYSVRDLDAIYVGMPHDKAIATYWDEMVYIYYSYGMTAADIIQSMCVEGAEASYYLELRAEASYEACAFGVDTETAFCCTNVGTSLFTTSSAEMSDNEFTLQIENIRERSARIRIQTTTDDQYTAGLIMKSAVEGKNDDEILAYLTSGFPLVAINGDFDETIGGLAPNTEYLLFAFGYQNEYVTTGLTTKTFTTIEEVVGGTGITFSQVYYSTQDVYEVDPKWGYTYRDAFWLISADFTPVGSTGTKYYSYYSKSQIDNWDDSQFQTDLLKGDGVSEDKVIYIVDYDTEYWIVGFVIDPNGNYGPVTKDGPHILTEEGRCTDNIEGFLAIMEGMYGSYAPKPETGSLYPSEAFIMKTPAEKSVVKKIYTPIIPSEEIVALLKLNYRKSPIDMIMPTASNNMF